jgi:hypothetical protein
MTFSYACQVRAKLTSFTITHFMTSSAVTDKNFAASIHVTLDFRQSGHRLVAFFGRLRLL